MKADTTQQNIPRGWQEKNLGDICNIINGSTPKRSVSEYWENGSIPWFTVDDIRRDGRIIYQTNQSITEKALKETSVKLLPENSVLLCCTASLGEVAFAKIPLTTNQQFNGLVSKDEKILFPYYLFYSAQRLGDNLKSKSGKTTINFLSVGTLSKEKVLLPTITEQQKIAEILGGVDEDIAKTQEVIEATEKLKRGLMQQLFTRGINNITPDIVPLGKVAKVQGGYSFKSSDFSDNGVPVIRISNIKDGYIKLDDIKYYPKEVTDRIGGFSLNTGDVVVAMSGATTGKIGIVRESDLPLLLNQRVGRFVSSKDIDGKYLYNIVISEFYQKRIWDFAIGGAQPNVSGPQLESIEIPLPKLSVQKDIAEILSSVDEKISVNKKLKEKLTLLKKGLMQDLLSGKVRTNI